MLRELRIRLTARQNLFGGTSAIPQQKHRFSKKLRTTARRPISIGMRREDLQAVGVPFPSGAAAPEIHPERFRQERVVKLMFAAIALGTESLGQRYVGAVKLLARGRVQYLSHFGFGLSSARPWLKSSQISVLFEVLLTAHQPDQSSLPAKC